MAEQTNRVLQSAKRNKDDEFYTSYEEIERELPKYKEQFFGKKVLCNCDDPFESNFCKFFITHFNEFKLDQLVCTSYSNSNVRGKEINLFTELEAGRGTILRISEVDDKKLKKKGFSSIINHDNVRLLNGNGDFASDECVELIKESDIIVTNPPFSLFRPFITLLTKHEKKFLVIGNMNAVTYKEIFPLIQNNLAWLGYHNGDMSFKVPADSEPRKTRYWVDETGQKWRSLGNAMWFTNLDVSYRHELLNLVCEYDPKVNPVFDNYDAILVSKVSEIPKDYFGIMAVPLTVLTKYNPDQFEIVGEANHGSDNPYDLFKPVVNGKELYKKILIRRNNVDVPVTEFHILDLFCGAGGFSYGMHKNPRFSTEVALDFNPHAAETFSKNMPDTSVFVGDITSAETRGNVIEESRRRGVNMIIGGPPCQGFSMKGKKLGLKDPRNFLFLEYLRIVEELKPEVFVIENVKSLLSTSAGYFKNEIVNTISGMGYHVSVGVLDASDFGVPQTRQRAIFICSRNKVITLPSASNISVTVRDAISDLSYLDSGEGEFEQDYKIDAQSDYQRLMRGSSSRLYNHKASNHKDVAIRKLEMIPPEKGKECLPEELHGNQKFKTTWGRLRWDEPSPTIDTRFDAASNGRNNHPYLHRAITPREAARIQSFDDSFIFYGSKFFIRQQIGNAVPPLLAKAIADRIDHIINNGI